MAKKRLSLPDFDPGVVIELPDGDDTREFNLRPATVDVQEAVQKALESAFKVLADDESSPRDVTEAKLGELDAVLAPTNGQKAVPSVLLLRAYDAKAVTGHQIDALIGEVRTAARPS